MSLYHISAHIISKLISVILLTFAGEHINVMENYDLSITHEYVQWNLCAETDTT
jgi:hypothetical protein